MMQTIKVGLTCDLKIEKTIKFKKKCNDMTLIKYGSG